MYITADNSNQRGALEVWENGVKLAHVRHAQVNEDGTGVVWETPDRPLPVHQVPLESQTKPRSGKFEIRHRVCGKPIKEVQMVTTSVLYCKTCDKEIGGTP